MLCYPKNCHAKISQTKDFNSHRRFYLFHLKLTIVIIANEMALNTTGIHCFISLDSATFDFVGST